MLLNYMIKMDKFNSATTRYNKSTSGRQTNRLNINHRQVSKYKKNIEDIVATSYSMIY